MTKEEAEILLEKEVGKAKTAREIDLAVTAWLRRIALIQEKIRTGEEHDRTGMHRRIETAN